MLKKLKIMKKLKMLKKLLLSLSCNILYVLEDDMGGIATFARTPKIENKCGKC